MSADIARPRVLLVGLGPTTLTALEGLTGEFVVVALLRDAHDATAVRAEDLGVPVWLDSSVAGVRRAVAELRPDAVVVSSFNRILDAELIGQCPFVNVHYAPLPRGRGRATVNWALINGDSEVAISIHWLVPDLDAGGILFQQSIPIGPASTVTTLYSELNELQRINIAAAVRAAIAGDPGLEQDESSATYYCTRTPEDGEIDWRSSAWEIDRKVRALQDPFPLAFSWVGLNRFEVISAVPLSDGRRFEGVIPGRVIGVGRDSGSVDVLTGDGILRLHRLRTEGQVEVDAAAVVSSVRQTLGLNMSAIATALRSVLGEETE